MNFGQIRDRMVERMAEYQAGAAEGAANASISANTLYARISTALRKMLREVADRQPDKVTSLSTFTYAANTESITLAAALKFRDIFSLERQVTTNVWEPVSPVTQWQDEKARIDTVWPGTGAMQGNEPVETSYAFIIQYDKLYIKNIPSEDLTLRARYFAAVTLLTPADSANSPDVITEEHHDLLALLAARSFMGETRSNTELEKEYRDGWAEFLQWAAGKPKRGPRFVHERGW